jgi:hypothetical protein
MLKFLINKFGPISILILLILFVKFYRKSGQFQKSFITASIITTLYLLNPKIVLAGTGEVDAFSPSAPQHHSRRPNPSRTSVFTGQTAPNKDNSGNGGGGNGNSEPDILNLESVEDINQRLEQINYHLEKMKKNEENQCLLCELDENVKAEKIEIVYRIKENPALVREAERAGRDQDAQRSLNNLIEQLSLGNQNPGIGTENVFKNVFELRGKNRARVYYRKVDAKIEILAKSVKSNQQKVINILKKLYD